MTLALKDQRLVACLLACALAACLPACDSPGTTEDETDATLTLGDVGPSLVPPDAEVRQPRDAAVPEEDADLRGPKLNSIFPNRGPVTGGTRLRVVGLGFLEGTTVQVGDQPCADLVIDSENRIDCTTPMVEAPGPVRLTVRWSQGGRPDVLEDAFTYFLPITVQSLSPDRSPVRGGVELTVVGSGFEDPTEVRIGDTIGRTRLENETTLKVIVPPGDAAQVDVLVRNVNGEVRLPDAFTYFEDLSVDDLAPVVGRVAGGDEVAFSGAGLLDDSVVTFDGAEAVVVASELNRTRLRVATPPGEPGVADVEVRNVNGRWTGRARFLYVDPDATGFGVVGIVPNRVSTEGQDTFVVGGAGFDEATVVEVDGVAAECVVESAQVLRCEAPPHARGPVDVVVQGGAESVRLDDGLTYFQPVDIFSISPERGAIAGGTWVEVRGEGFTPEVELVLDGLPVEVAEFVDAGRIWAITPAGRAGLVSLQARTEDDLVVLPDAYEYFNPVSRYGGVWGDPINGAINVTVLDALSSAPIPDATVLAVPSDAAGPGAVPLVALTDANGQAVVSAKTLQPPQNVTAAAPSYEVATVEKVEAENVTVYLYPQEPPPPSGGGGGEPPAGVQLSGTVIGLDNLPKPLDPDLIVIAMVDTTHASPYGRRANPGGEPNGLLTEDGPFDIVARPGEFAVVVTAAIARIDDVSAYRRGNFTWWDLHELSTPIAMGFQRYLSVSPGESLEGIEVSIDYPMDLDVPVHLDNPPRAEEGQVGYFAVVARIDFGPEGYWELDPRGMGESSDFQIAHLPDVRGWDEDLEVEWEAQGSIDTVLLDSPPYFVAFERLRDMTAGVEISPVAGIAFFDNPANLGTLGPDRRIAWHFMPGVEGPTVQPDAYLLTIDGPGNLPLWTYIAPGGISEVVLPILPPDVAPGGLVDEENGMVLTLIPMQLETPLGFDDFTYEDLGFWRRTSYSVSRVRFSP